MSRDFENFAARAAPAIFVVLWSTGFIGTKYVLNSAEPLTYLAIRMACVVGLMAAAAGSRLTSLSTSRRLTGGRLRNSKKLPRMIHGIRET